MKLRLATDLAKKKAEEAEAECTFAPKISKRSEFIANSMRRSRAKDVARQVAANKESHIGSGIFKSLYNPRRVAEGH